MNSMYFIYLFIFAVGGFVITGLIVKPLLFLYVLPSCQADFLVPASLGLPSSRPGDKG